MKMMACNPRGEGHHAPLHAIYMTSSLDLLDLPCISLLYF